MGTVHQLYASQKMSGANAIIAMDLIHQGHKLNHQDVASILNVDIATVRRLFRAMREQLGVQIVYDRKTNSVQVTDWGVLNAGRLPKLAEQIKLKRLEGKSNDR